MTAAEGRSEVELGWTWDPTLYAGSAEYYATGRVPYPAALATALAAALGLDGTGRLLDVGCGPGSLTLLLAPYVTDAIGVDADADMLAAAARLARRAQLVNTTWRHLRAEDLPADLPAVDLIVFAQSLHWMDRARVAATARAMLSPGGAVVHVHATTHQGLAAEDGGPELAHPRPPWEAVTALVQRYLGSQPRAGQRMRPNAGGGGFGGGGGEAGVYRGAGFTGPERLSVPGWTVERSAEELLAAVHSLSWAAPHLFDDRLADFDVDLRRLLAGAADSGRFSEHMRDIDVDIWR